jgi:hypothetical protein
MGQEEIFKIISRVWPEYITYREILLKTGISRNNLFKCLRKLQKRDEIEYIMVLTDNQLWIKKYREKR